ncbi:glycosyltransferase family 2 protein [Mycoplasma bradburyae]|uniref:Glycosyltransferase family 2 protein n=1 Tax=Mycoplasma bradburyae TaxID=2963128 RepID=A0ABT5GA55_9MOLU|nr:glycosyltransferase family 2 protein [Mycoplasma bradburyae]MDC4181619.1 glycosyltransferase family 2 protein [Mycoplasma bradburyae]UTS69959.1 glycosyltransferase family 2 protein [Mycoplasma bradburyae]
MNETNSRSSEFYHVKNPLVSILIPVYNNAKTIETTVSSALFQSYKNIEIICIDDSSSDNSYQVLKRFETFEQNVRIYKNQTQKGRGFVYDQLVKYASGHFFLFLEPPNTLNQDAIKHMISVNEQFTEIIVGRNMVATTSNPMKGVYDIPTNDKKLSDRNSIDYIFANSFNTQGILIKKNFFEALDMKFGKNPYIPDFYLKYDLLANCDFFRVVWKPTINFIESEGFYDENRLKFLVAKYRYVFHEYPKMIDWFNNYVPIKDRINDFKSSIITSIIDQVRIEYRSTVDAIKKTFEEQILTLLKNQYLSSNYIFKVPNNLREKLKTNENKRLFK